MIEAQPFPRDEMLGLAERLLREIEGGLKPVWPSTLPYAHRLVLGLRTMRMTRPDRVAHIISHAPIDTALDWPDLLNTV